MFIVKLFNNISWLKTVHVNLKKNHIAQVHRAGL